MPVGALADHLASLQMLVGVVAFNVLDVLPPADNRALGVLLTGYVFQGAFVIVRGSRTRRIAYAYISSGLGFFMTFFYICIYIIR